MKPRILIVLISALLAACASEDISVTGISRECAIAIAEGSCRDYPQRYSIVERAVWLNRFHCWEVNLADAQGNGKSYRINSHHRVISVTQIHSGTPVQTARTYPVQPSYVPQNQNRLYNQPSSAPERNDSEREFYFKDGDYYERPR